MPWLTRRQETVNGTYVNQKADANTHTDQKEHLKVITCSSNVQQRID
jgi:hypothetical protein